MRRSNFRVMHQLISLASPLAGTMVLAVLLGVVGNLCAIMIPVIGSYALVGRSVSSVIIMLPILAVLRGIFHYLEQNRNHYLAFKLLALIRDKVFLALRRLAPAKLEGRDKGNLIAVVTADIELLEVFYAHTISPICIALIVSIIMTLMIGALHPVLGAIALVSYCIIGIVVPVVAAKNSRSLGEKFREKFGELDSFVLDSLRGVNESIQYGEGKKRLENIYTHSDELAEKEGRLKGAAGTNAAATSGTILVLDIIMLMTSVFLFESGEIDFEAAVLSIVALMSNFGPTVALANLGTGLQNTLAAGNRVLDILEEEPLIEKVTKGSDISFEGASFEKVNFAYDNEKILKDFNLDITRGKIIGITGRSGSGKSTLLKLLMRFWDVSSGKISFAHTDTSEAINIQSVNTESLQAMEAFVAQDTQLFHDSIISNLLIANLGASRQEVIEACKKASIHDFIMTLPKGYDTEVGELGETLSGGERQRLGIARAFLHNASLILLDEPTSNLDSLNEAVILKSIKDYRKDKTIVLVSHRKSTMCIADEICSMENGRVS